ncbi:hypothetical protein [[Clostridium] polysaccharolyticum]|uniref:Uncharacterized protein n=1 Tax=[Clostridium] polysaccharolyticum TaxID=29364 RepID=A0A1I0DVI9_9FIRM|nr:hypothetical protein [[Clostridium] polysaccharolyticum]SET36685.1 hypothetical protein SAMN04487772_1172 [[Clostridium] polysaccharolyticum]
MSRASIHFDKKKNVLIFPSWRDENGLSRKSIKYIKLEEEYDEKKLGEKIIEALEVSAINEQENKLQNTWKQATKLQSWKAFQKKYECVMIDVNDEGIWYIAKYRKLKDGSYGLEKGDEEKYSREYTEPLTAQQLGHIVLEMLEIK